MTVNAHSAPLPRRKHLPHDVPSWVDPGARFFLTLNCAVRGLDQLCRDGKGETLLRSATRYDDLRRWHLWLVVVMPDRLHLIASFGRERGMRQVVSAWKGYQAKALGIDWQSGFFDHRLRTDEEFTRR